MLLKPEPTQQTSTLYHYENWLRHTKPSRVQVATRLGNRWDGGAALHRPYDTKAMVTTEKLNLAGTCGGGGSAVHIPPHQLHHREFSQ